MDSLRRRRPRPANSLDVLDAVQRRVLWLATSIVHHANKVRETPSGVKVGGHQASSASMVSIMTALYFEHLRAPDRVSVKPHAAPVLHAINYLLGRLDRALPDRAARVRRAAELPEPRQGSRPRRLLDRLGRHRRDRDALERARPPLRRRPLRGAPGRAPGRAARRRRARRGRDLGGARRPDGPAPRRGAVDRRPQPPVARPRRARHRRRPDRRDVRGRRLADDHGQVRAPAARAVRARRRRGAARAHRRDAQRGVPATAAQPGRGAARAPAGRRRDRARRPAHRRRPRRRRAARGDPRPRRPRPRRPARRVPRADSDHDRPSVIFAYTIKAWSLADAGPSGEPLRAAHRAAVARAGRRDSAPTPTTRGRASTRRSPEAELCRDAAERLERPEPPSRRPPRVPPDVGRDARREGLDAAGVRALLRRPRATRRPTSPSTS